MLITRRVFDVVAPMRPCARAPARTCVHARTCVLSTTKKKFLKNWRDYTTIFYFQPL